MNAARGRARKRHGKRTTHDPVSRLRPAVRAAPLPENPAMSLPPSPIRRGSRADKKGGVARAAPHLEPRLQRRDGVVALALITEPMRRGDGWRHVWLGDTGTGKTWAQRRLVELPGQLVLIHDDAKAEPEYPEHARYFRSPAELLALPADEAAQLSAAAFRGDAYSAVVCEVDEVAALALTCARVRVPVRLVVDEWERAMSDGGRKMEAPNLRTCLTTGRVMGLSVAGGAQIPQRVGDTVLNSASSVGLFRCGPAAVNYLDERLYFDREMLGTIPTLQVGDFVIHRPGHPWDRTVYRF